MASLPNGRLDAGVGAG